MSAAMQELSFKLFEVMANEKIVFCSWEPQVLDSTTLSKLFLKFKIQLLNGISYNLNINANNALVFQKIFEKINASKTIPLLGYNWKEVFTFFKRVTKKDLQLRGVVDLAWFESYLRFKDTSGSIRDQVALFKKAVSNKEIWTLYREVYEPLITTTVPAMEAFGLLNDALGVLVYPNYHIEGQENGRLSCSCNFNRCYNPHSLGENEKKNLILIATDYKFISFDFRNMEVSVLANLSSDDVLMDIINNKSIIVYETIFEMVTGLKNYSDARNLGKKMFLPCIYGQGVGGLAKSLDISQEQASIYLDKLSTIFKKSFQFVESNQKKASEQHTIHDEFGRVRNLEKNETHKARNFVIQSPAALICLEFLNNLHNQSNGIYKIAFSVHDGYYIVAHDSKLQDAYNLAKKVLTQKSRYLNVQLNVSARIGKTLDKMVKIGK
jgi:hypothetical protein